MIVRRHRMHELHGHVDRILGMLQKTNRRAVTGIQNDALAFVDILDECRHQFIELRLEFNLLIH